MSDHGDTRDAVEDSPSVVTPSNANTSKSGADDVAVEEVHMKELNATLRAELLEANERIEELVEVRSSTLLSAQLTIH